MALQNDNNNNNNNNNINTQKGYLKTSKLYLQHGDT